MSCNYEIRYLKTAENDLYEIFDYRKIYNRGAAISLLNKIDQSISQLKANPRLGVVPKDSRLKTLGYRMLIVEKYLIFYVVKDKYIQIRRVLHGARKFGFLVWVSWIFFYYEKNLSRLWIDCWRNWRSDFIGSEHQNWKLCTNNIAVSYDIKHLNKKDCSLRKL